MKEPKGRIVKSRVYLPAILLSHFDENCEHFCIIGVLSTTESRQRITLYKYQTEQTRFNATTHCCVIRRTKSEDRHSFS